MFRQADRRGTALRRVTAVSLPAAALTLVAACSGTPVSVALTAQQVLHQVADQSARVTSVTETVAVQVTGAQSSTTSATVQIALKPALQASENLAITAGGQEEHLQVVLTATTIYLSAPGAPGGKKWLKIDLATLKNQSGTAGLLGALGQLVSRVQTSNVDSQAQLLSQAQNARVVGKATVGGVPTTEYAGTINTAKALATLPSSLRASLGPILKSLGTSTIHFSAWVDSQHHVRKLTETETLNGEVISTVVNVTSINQPVHVALPPAGETSTLPGV